MWTLEEALLIIKLLYHHCYPIGWFPALTGGVLRSGKSNHDLDVVFVPHEQPSLESLKEIFREIFGWSQIRTAEQMQEGWKLKGSKDMKHVEEWRTLDGKRIDVIIMRK